MHVGNTYFTSKAHFAKTGTKITTKKNRKLCSLIYTRWANMPFMPMYVHVQFSSFCWQQT
ncbi:MAG: hypothetical protein BGO09_10205 [Bacteroidetes bacterium 47-18]|nr:MAG: hypothetical protein BGO09_10205 [Bacteroidetes bacterium 47-18]